MGGNDLTGWNFAGQNLMGAVFADYSWWSVLATNLTNADLSQANLTKVSFWYAAQTGADLTGADTRGATGLVFAGATLTNTILPDGHVAGLELNAGQTLVVRDYVGDPDPRYWSSPIPPLPIHVEQQFVMDTGGILQLLFEADAWGSTTSFDPGIPVTLGGTLGLDFAQGVDLASQVGRTFQVFDWTGVEPIGEFEIASPYLWDVANLYTAGQITFVGAPEASSLALLASGLSILFWRRLLSVTGPPRVERVVAACGWAARAAHLRGQPQLKENCDARGTVF